MSWQKNRPRLLAKFFLGITTFGATLSMSLAVAPTPAYAALDPKADCTTAAPTASNCKIIKYLVTFINILSAAVGVVVVIMIAVGGVQYTMSKDNPQATAAAKARIRNAIFALLIFIFTFAFLQWLVPGGIF